MFFFFFGPPTKKNVKKVFGTVFIFDVLKEAIRTEILESGGEGIINETNRVLSSEKFSELKSLQTRGGESGYWSWDEAGFEDCLCLLVGVCLDRDGRIIVYENPSYRFPVVETGDPHGKPIGVTLVFAERWEEGKGKDPVSQIVRVNSLEEDKTYLANIIIEEAARRYNKERTKETTNYIDPILGVGVWG